jgi:hypothetical protein
MQTPQLSTKTSHISSDTKIIIIIKLKKKKKKKEEKIQLAHEGSSLLLQSHS